MQLDIVRIGNSRGIRLPQNVIRECGFMNTVEAELINHSLILKAPEKSRAGWENLFQIDLEDDRDIDILSFQNRWDDEEWEW